MRLASKPDILSITKNPLKGYDHTSFSRQKIFSAFFSVFCNMTNYIKSLIKYVSLNDNNVMLTASQLSQTISRIHGLGRFIISIILIV